MNYNIPDIILTLTLYVEEKRFDWLELLLAIKENKNQ